jgi:hypothetical protein
MNYGHLFDSLPVTPVEWWDDLLWPDSRPYAPATKATTDGGRNGGKLGILTNEPTPDAGI